MSDKDSNSHIIVEENNGAQEKIEETVLNGIKTKTNNEDVCSEFGVDLIKEIDEETYLKDVKEAKSLKNNNTCSCNQYLDKIKDLEEKCFQLNNINNELDEKLKLVHHKYETTNKEKEAMVIRYAVNEKAVIDQKTLTDKVERKLKDATRENEILQHKVATMCSEKSRICQILDNKCHELKSSQQELESTKSDLSILETKLKWCQNNLKNQVEANKEKDENIENLSKKLQDVTNQIEKAKSDAEEYIKAFRYSQNNEAFVLGKQVQELQAQLILLKHEKNEKDGQISQTQSCIEKMKSKEIELVQENKDLLLKLGDLQKQFTNLETEYVALRNNNEEQRQLSEELNAKSLELEQLKCVQKIKDEQIEELNVQLAAFKQRNIDLELDMKSCKEREAEMLAFTKQLTDKNVALQSEFTSMETKVQQLVCEQTIFKNSAKENEKKANTLAIQLNEERRKHTEDVESLKAELAEQIKKCESLNREVADHKGENLVLKRKLELSLREVNKELQQCRKKLEQNEISSNSTSSSSSTVSVGEGGSNSSPSPPTEQIKVIQPEMVIEKQTLIDHIVKLQRVSARKSEKIDFLEEHINTLVEELQKKTRLLQNYMLHDHAGALTSNSMDKNKANIAKTHGIMASVYGSRVADSNLTLELSLDINRKLQAVLEDALLKNITLKENVDTLGAEIDRLNKLVAGS